MIRRCRWLIGVAGLCVLMILGVSRFVVHAQNPALTTSGLELSYQGQAFTGVIVSWYPNFRPAQLASYRAGQHVGREIFWYPNGRKELDRSYRAGVYHGVSQTWYESGRIKTYRNYIDGLADGEQWTWGTEGQVIEYNLYAMDREITHKTWTFDGRPFHNYVYQAGEKVGMMGEQFCKRLSR